MIRCGYCLHGSVLLHRTEDGALLKCLACSRPIASPLSHRPLPLLNGNGTVVVPLLCKVCGSPCPPGHTAYCGEACRAKVATEQAKIGWARLAEVNQTAPDRLCEHQRCSTTLSRSQLRYCSRRCRVAQATLDREARTGVVGRRGRNRSPACDECGGELPRDNVRFCSGRCRHQHEAKRLGNQSFEAG